MKIPCRCSRRGCQTRRSLNKRPEKYVTWPTCYVPGCWGRMRVDKVRHEGKEKRPPVCANSACRYVYPNSKRVPFHRVSTRGCADYDLWIETRNAAPRSVHSPISKDDWVPF